MDRTDDRLDNDRLDLVRARALDRADRAERRFKLSFVGAAVVEAVFLAAMLLIADFSDRTHLLILVATVTVYSVVGAGLIALGLHVDRVGLRILKGIEAAGAPRPGS